MLGKKLFIGAIGAVFALAAIPAIGQASVHYTGTAPLSARTSHHTLTTSAKHTELAKHKKGKHKGKHPGKKKGHKHGKKKS